MGYTNTSDHGGPVFVNTPAQTIADLNALRAHAELIGNSKTGTTAARTNPATVKWDGLTWYDTDIDVLFVCQDDSWVPIAGIPVEGVLGHAADVTPTVALEYLERDHRGMVEFYWSGTYINNLANGSTIGSVPAGFRPPATYETAVAMSQGGGGAAIVTVQAGGNITVFLPDTIGAKKVSFYAKYPVAT